MTYEGHLVLIKHQWNVTQIAATFLICKKTCFRSEQNAKLPIGNVYEASMLFRAPRSHRDITRSQIHPAVLFATISCLTKSFRIKPHHHLAVIRTTTRAIESLTQEGPNVEIRTPVVTDLINHSRFFVAVRRPKGITSLSCWL